MIFAKKPNERHSSSGEVVLWSGCVFWMMKWNVKSCVKAAVLFYFFIFLYASVLHGFDSIKSI